MEDQSLALSGKAVPPPVFLPPWTSDRWALPYLGTGQLGYLVIRYVDGLERLRLSIIQSMPARKQVFARPVLHLCDYPPQKTNPGRLTVGTKPAG